MMKPNLSIVVAALMCLAFSVKSPQAADADGSWGLGLQGGAYKLVLTDHSDVWTPGWLANADLKYGLTSKWYLGVEGSWMKTYLADLSDPSKQNDGAGLSMDKNSNGLQQRAYVAGLFAEYQFRKDSGWSPYVVVGPGMYMWKWIDVDGNTLMSDDPALDDPQSGLDVPPEGVAGDPYELKDQELYVMGGLGVEFYPSDLLSFELGMKFRYLTHVFTSFTGDQDVVGSDPGQLDLPSGITEAFAGLTFHFGGGCPEASATASGAPASGSIPLEVQFNGTATGGCPEYTYAWDFGDGGTSTDPDPRHTYEAEGSYTSSLTVTDSKGNQAVSSFSVTASCPPLTSTASANPSGTMAPLIVSFGATASGGCPPVTYAWDFGDGNTSAEQNPTYTYQTEGNYTPSLTVTDAKGATSRAAAGTIAATAAFVPTPEKPIVLEGVNFETNKPVLLEGSGQILNRVAESLIAHPEVKVEVGGHCDSDGSDSYNRKLSERRANTVRDYLIKMGVPAAQLTAKGYGEAQPIADNVTPEGKAANRRVELKRM
jgi:outer membrane protein OmpA-like peptidoglycan-associated protein